MEPILSSYLHVDSRVSNSGCWAGAASPLTYWAISRALHLKILELQLGMKTLFCKNLSYWDLGTRSGVQIWTQGMV